MPASTGDPSHDAVNFTGIVLLSLKLRTGAVKLPPVASDPPIAGRKPVKPSAARVRVNAHCEPFPLESVAVATTVVTPTGNPEPGWMEW